MKIIYKGRGEGKTTELVKLSASTNTHILCMNPRHICSVAKELGISIPTPISIRDYKPHMYDVIIVDDAEIILRRLIGNIECMSISKE